jgi:hypothetical protein
MALLTSIADEFRVSSVTLIHITNLIEDADMEVRTAAAVVLSKALSKRNIV